MGVLYFCDDRKKTAGGRLCDISDILLSRNFKLHYFGNLSRKFLIYSYHFRTKYCTVTFQNRSVQSLRKTNSIGMVYTNLIKLFVT